MKNILFCLLSILILTSCKYTVGLNYEKRTKGLSLGMPKAEAIAIMGKDYYIESLSETGDGQLEVLTFYDGGMKHDKTFTLYFLKDKLKEFHKYIPPYTPQEIRVVKE